MRRLTRKQFLQLAEKQIAVTKEIRMELEKWYSRFALRIITQDQLFSRFNIHD